MNDTSAVYDSMFGEQSEKLGHGLDLMPAVITPAGYTHRFELFFNKLVERLLTNQARRLYDISDKSLDVQQFCDMYDTILGQPLGEILSLDNKLRGVNLMLNPDAELRIPEVLEALTLHVYHLDVPNNDFEKLLNLSATQIIVQSTDIYFTYKNGEFCVVSSFTPFRNR